MVKNKTDIIGQTVDHLRRQGEDGALVVDSGSADGPRELRRERAYGASLLVRDDREPAYFLASKMQFLAGWHARRGAGWIAPFDADADALRLTGPRSGEVGGDHWRDLVEEPVGELGMMWREMLEGRGHPKLEWSPRGKLRPIALSSWSSRCAPDRPLGA